MVAKICSKFLDPSLKAALKFGFINGLLDPRFINKLAIAGSVKVSQSLGYTYYARNRYTDLTMHSF